MNLVMLALFSIAQSPVAPEPPPAPVEAAPAPAPIPEAAPQPPTKVPAPAVVQERPKLLILDFRDDGVGEKAVRVIHDTLVAHIAGTDRVDVVSTDDMRRVLDMEAQKQAIGCGDESCLGEIAGALGAQLLLYGTAGKLGDLVVVNVSLYDAGKATSVGRENIEVARLDDLPAPLRAAGDRLMARVGVVMPVADSGIHAGTLLMIGGGVGAVAGAIVGGAGVLLALDANNKLAAGRGKETQGALNQHVSDANTGWALAGAGAIVAVVGVAFAVGGFIAGAIE